MAFTEPVYKNKGGLFGGQTGKEYKSSDVEERGGEKWVKPGVTPCAPGEIIVEAEYSSPAKLKY